MSSDNILIDMNNQFEINEFMLSAILENLQLGRLDDCIGQYAILQQKLLNIAEVLDSYPVVSEVEQNLDLHHNLYGFEDKLVKNDVLEQLRPIEERKTLSRQTPASCSECYKNNVRYTYIVNIFY